MIALKPQSHGVILPVRARAGARHSGLRGEHDGMLKVSVTVAPEKGKANKAILALLTKQLSLRRGQLELLSGETSSEKRFLVTGITLEELSERLRDVLG